MTAPRSRSFIRREDGALTSFGLFITLAGVCIGGLGLDVANAIMVRTHLQVAADSAAHAALVAREYKTAAEAKAIGVAVAQASMPPGSHGNAITEDDIVFGRWDASTEEFEIDDTSNRAVLVSTEKAASRSNGVATYFLRFIGMGQLDVVSQSVFEAYYPTCFLEGFVADNRVDVQSNNTYGNGFCIHSNDHVEINNGNTFLDSTVVSMPDSRDLVVPSDGMESNPGLADALRDGSYRPRILDRMDDIIAGVEDPSSPYFRTDYVDIDPLTASPVARKTLAAKGGVDVSDWVPGAIHTLNCPSSKTKVNFGKAGQVFTRGVLITDCIIHFGANVEIHDIIVVNLNDDVESITGAAGFTVGRDDGCSPGGGSQIITKGGMSFPADLQVYGGQLIAAKTVSFAARPDGIEGISIVSGDQIDGTSLINVGFCGGLGMDNNYMADYFRLAT